MSKLRYGGFILLAIFLIVGIVYVNNTKQEVKGYEFPGPAEIVKQYFNSWEKKDYPNMYAAISDGFKKIEPTAKDLASFKGYAESQGINDIEIVNVEEKTNDGKTASIDYAVKFSNTEQDLKGAYILKFREGDLIRGWKLINPYGENVDTS